MYVDAQLHQLRLVVIHSHFWHLFCVLQSLELIASLAMKVGILPQMEKKFVFQPTIRANWMLLLGSVYNIYIYMLCAIRALVTTTKEDHRFMGDAFEYVLGYQIWT